MKSSRPLKIVFDAGVLADNRKSGVGFYSLQLVSRLAKESEVELVGHYFGKLANLPKIAGVTYIRSGRLSRLLALGLRKLGLRLPYELFTRKRADVLLFPNFTRWPSLFRSPSVLVIHDLVFLDHPAWVKPKNLHFLSRYVPKDIKKSSLIICPSGFTKDRLDYFYKAGHKAVVCGSLPGKLPVAVKPKHKLPKRYFLAVGTIEPRKNFLALVEAFCSLPADYKKHAGLVIAGATGWLGADAMERIRQLSKKEPGIVLMDYVSSAELDYLYSHCFAVVCPAFYEGLGMPVLEAMFYSKPVLASDIPPFRENAGKAPLYFNPHKGKEISESLMMLLQNLSLAQQFSAASAETYRTYLTKQKSLFDKFYKAMLELN